MVSTRSKGKNGSTDKTETGGSEASSAQTGEKRAAPASSTENQAKPASKKAKKVEKEGKLDIGENGQLGLKKEEDTKDPTAADKSKADDGGVKDAGQEESKAEKESTPAGSNDDPKHGELHCVTESSADEQTLILSCIISGTLESGHIYFLYRPKVEVDDPESIDDVSK